MAALHPLRRLATAVLVLTLPLLASHCSKKSEQTPGVRGLTWDESYKFQSLHDPLPDRKSKSPGQVPDDRLEALGDLALKNRNFDNSLRNYLQILQEHPERYDLHHKVGVIFLLTGKLEAAQKELALVLAHQPDMLQAHEAMGIVHLQGKQYPLAIDEFQYVLAQDPGRAKTNHLLGVTFLESGRPERAILALKAAIGLDPRRVSSLISLSQAYLQQKDYPQAVANLKKAQALAPENQKVNQLLGLALAAQKQYPQALDAFLKAGDEAQAYNNIGVSYFMDGQYEEAAKCFQRAIELRPTYYHDAKTNLQRALEKLQETRKDGR
jgi:tetratricopeptide (TPR) repeat protein